MAAAHQLATADAVAQVLREGRPTLQSTALGACMVRGPIRDAGNAIVFRADCAGMSRPAAVKICCSGAERRIDPAGARQQYEALAKLDRVWPGEGPLQCVRPYALFEDQALILLEWAPGRPMSQVVFAIGTRRQRGEHLARMAGAWLSMFHRLGRSDPKPLDVDDKLPAVAQALQSANAAGCRTLRRALRTLESTGPQIRRWPVDQSWVHGDFKLDNLLIDEERLIGIDVHLRHRNAVVYDLGSFLNHMEMCCLDPRNPWRIGSRTRLGDSFLEGYGPSRPPPAALAWSRLFQLTCGWIALRQGAAESLRRRTLELAFSSTARRLCRELERAA